VFVVDDDKIYHFILKNLLSKNAIAISPCFCENGFDALEKLKEKITTNNLPDVIMLDINMPVMDGWQFLEEFKKLKADFNLQTPIYLVTSSNDALDINRAKAYENEIVDYFIKPINEEDICKIFLN
jgi:two-component system chemotaxis response regulator CheY